MSGAEALARVLRSVGIEIGYAGADTYRTVVAERILADPGPLLEALAEAGVLRDRETAAEQRGRMATLRKCAIWLRGLGHDDLAAVLNDIAAIEEDALRRPDDQDVDR